MLKYGLSLKESSAITYLPGNYPMNSMSFVKHPEYLQGKDYCTTSDKKLMLLAQQNRPFQYQLR